MKTRTLFLLFAFMIILPATSNCQVGNLLKNKLNKAINAGTRAADKEANREIDSAAQRKADKMVNDAAANQNVGNEPNQTNQSEGQSNQGNQGSKGFKMGGFAMGGKVDIKHNDEYNFNGSIYMQMETYEKKDPMKMDYYTYFNSNNANAAIETKNISTEDGKNTGNAVFVFDNDNKCFMMMTDMNGSKTAIISNIPNDSTLKAQTAGKTGNPPKIVKTGNTRVVAGYKCDEYLVTDPDNKTSSKIWTSKEVNLKADRKNWGKAGLPSYYNSDFEGGMVLAMESYNEKNVLQMKMETKEINQNIKHSVSAVGYSFMQMNFNQGKK